MAKKDDDDLTPAAPPVNPFDVLDRLASALEGLKTQQGGGGVNEDLMARLAGALERVSAAQVEGAKIIADESKRAHRPSNEVVPRISTLNPRGERDYPKPKLKCPMWIPWQADPDSMTREEIELANLLEPGEFVVRKMDGTKVKVSIKITYGLDEITPSRLLLTHETAFNNDNKQWMPPLVDIFRTILTSKPETRARAAAVLTMDEEIALIEAEKLPVSA